MSPAGADGIAMFGFVTGFLTLVVLGYRSRLRTRFPVLAVCLECCAVYGFLSSDWMLGFCLSALGISEFSRGRSTPPVGGRQQEMLRDSDSESRITRMFGRA